jgi:hypothetical protein
MDPLETISVTEPLVEFHDDASQWNPQPSSLNGMGSSSGSVLLPAPELQRLVSSVEQLRASIDTLVARLQSMGAQETKSNSGNGAA